jgi:hypothetical protein
MSFDTPELSVIIPVGARHADLEELYTDYARALAQTGKSVEWVFVLDGALPNEAAALERLSARGEPITTVRLTRRFGESTALMAGFQSCHGRTILTLPAYYQRSRIAGRVPAVAGNGFAAMYFMGSSRASRASAIAIWDAARAV